MTLIIAEAGVNHNGQAKLAFELVDAAYAAGADIVKFQTFNAKELVTETTKKADYQSRNTSAGETQLEMLSKLELDRETYIKLASYCSELGIEFLSTAFDSDSLDFLVNELKLSTLKIPSGELTNTPFVLQHAQTGKRLIVSTGMANLAEIESALEVIAFGLLHPNTQPSEPEDFALAYSSPEGQSALRKSVTLLHCTTEYPAPPQDINLRCLPAMQNAFGLETGYSDHSLGNTVSIAATALGATVIEKHFTLDNTMDGPDHKASLEPLELKELVSAIRDVERALGDGVKRPKPSEYKNRAAARKFLVANTAIEKGDRFHEKNLKAIRAGEGLSPNHYWRLIGTKAKRSYNAGEIIHD